jgi:hypothetical protein
MRNRLLLAIVGVAPLLPSVAVTVAAAPPTRIPFTVDATFPSDVLTALCGIPVSVHLQGGGTTTLFYDRSGTHVIRELDTLAEGATTTIFSPIDAGGTGKSFTEVTHSPATFLYPEGTEIGDPAIVMINGVQRTSGPGNPRIVGHEVDQGVIIDFTPDGVPVVDTVALISQSGQFDTAAVLQARCATLTGP